MTEAQAERIAVALERIAYAVNAWLVPVTGDAPVGCQHPEDARIDFGLTNGQHDWQCRLCEFRSVPQEG